MMKYPKQSKMRYTLEQRLSSKKTKAAMSASAISILDVYKRQAESIPSGGGALPAGTVRLSASSGKLEGAVHTQDTGRCSG